MQIQASLSRLGQNDARLIGRDSFLSGMLAYIIFISIILRFALPWLNEQVANNPDLDVNVPEFYPLLVGFFCIYLASVLSGLIIGFIMLDERDDNTLKAMLVTPMPLPHYMTYRVVIPMAIAFVACITEVLIVNQALIPVWQLVIISACASICAPLLTFFFAVFAENKVQGFALNKIIGTAGLLIFVAWFLPEPFEYLAGIFPPYWFVKSYWLAYTDSAIWFAPLIIGVVYSFGLLRYLMQRFTKVAYAS